MGKPAVVHWEVTGKDGKKLTDFYTKLFDWQGQFDPKMNYALIQSDAGKGIGGGIGSVQEGTKPYATFYVEVDDPQAYLAKVEKLGGKTVVPVTEIPDIVTFAMFTDPEGNMIGLVKSENK